jgi:hypothetical protein
MPAGQRVTYPHKCKSLTKSKREQIRSRKNLGHLGAGASRAILFEEKSEFLGLIMRALLRHRRET